MNYRARQHRGTVWFGHLGQAVGFAGTAGDGAVVKAERFRAQFDGTTGNLKTENRINRPSFPSVKTKRGGLGGHTSPAKLVRNKLIVSVGDAIWQRQLNALHSQIVERRGI